KVTVRPSAEVSQDIASLGSALSVSGLVNTSASNMVDRIVWRKTSSEDLCGSSVLISLEIPTVRTPPPVAAARPGNPLMPAVARGTAGRRRNWARVTRIPIPTFSGRLWAWLVRPLGIDVSSQLLFLHVWLQAASSAHHRYSCRIVTGNKGLRKRYCYGT